MSSRVVAVVGASSGIGAATAHAFAAQGADLVLVARSDESLQRTARRCRSAGAASVTILAVDASTTQGCAELVELTVSRHRRIDVVVHTATVMAYGTLDQVPEDIFTSVVDTAVHGTARLARAVLPVMRRQQHGTLIVVNSLLGSVTVPGMGAYATAKWGQRAILRTLQQETLHDKGVHVCIVSPGSINTPIYDQAANYTGRAPRPPWPVLDPAQVAEVICGLADRPRRHVSVPVGPTNPLIVAGFRLLAPVYDLLVGPLFSLAALTAQTTDSPGNVQQPRPEGEAEHGRWPRVEDDSTTR